MITNNLNLPAPLVAAILADDYDNGGADISVTSLIKPPRMVELERRHRDQIIEDASDRIWSLIGRIGHTILAAGAKANLVEHRLFMPVLGWTISGQVDILNGRTISDYKFTSVWSIKDGAKPEWEQQLNLYRLLAEENGIAGIKELEICAILRDWSKMEAKRDRNYPQSGVQMFRLPMWSPAKAEGYLHERVKLHQNARVTLPECSPEDRWERPTRWAVMKEGRKSALRVLDDYSDAMSWVALNGYISPKTISLAELVTKPGISIQERPGERVRCSSYCSVAPFCQQYQDYLKANNEPVEAEAVA